MKNLKLIGVKINIITMIMEGMVDEAMKLIKYLYKHKFKYETKPIKWMYSNEAAEFVAKYSRAGETEGEALRFLHRETLEDSLWFT